MPVNLGGVVVYVPVAPPPGQPAIPMPPSVFGAADGNNACHASTGGGFVSQCNPQYYSPGKIDMKTALTCQVVN